MNQSTGTRPKSGYTEIAIAGGDTAQPLALAKRLRCIERHRVAGATRFLDCGCGAGEYVFQLVDRLHLDAHGVEYDVEKVRRGQRHPQHGFRISHGDLQALGLESAQWDYAMLNEVLEHVPDDSAALREVHRVLRPGGTLFIFSPNRWFPFETHGVHLKASGRRVPHWFPFIPYVPLSVGNRFLKYWARNYWPSQLKHLVHAAGFSILEVSFIWLTFEGISGNQPKVITMIRPLLRKLADVCEFLPFVTRFGVSQVFVCRK